MLQNLRKIALIALLMAITLSSCGYKTAPIYVEKSNSQRSQDAKL